jgi:pyridoxal phosphate enzyme (YggS family)
VDAADGNRLLFTQLSWLRDTSRHGLAERLLLAAVFGPGRLPLCGAAITYCPSISYAKTSHAVSRRWVAYTGAVSIEANLERLRNQIAEACARAGRNSDDVALMAVSKMHPADALLEAYEAGQRLFGENRVQEFAGKVDALAGLLPRPVVHLIGPLQNNKTAKAAELFDAVDTIDSLKTARRLNDAAAALAKVLPVLVEVKLSPEDTKHGLAPQELPSFLAEMLKLGNLRAAGLMTVPPWSEDAEIARPYFQHLRRLRDENQPAHPGLKQLSMGMSNDFAVAIEEGSTTVRIGTAIFGKRIYA